MTNMAKSKRENNSQPKMRDALVECVGSGLWFGIFAHFSALFSMGHVEVTLSYSVEKTLMSG